MEEERTSPSRPLSPKARWVWYSTHAFSWAGVLIAAIVLNIRIDSVLVTLAGALTAAAFIPWVAIAPELRWRHWRWDVHPEAIDIRHGAFVVRRTLIPMLRVQHVETTQDLLERALDLATVRVYTAAGRHRIPLLPCAEAEHLRDRIAALARTADAA